MGNCLVTKLKGSVDNSNLVGLNELVCITNISLDEYRTMIFRIVNETENPVLFKFSQAMDVYNIAATTVLASNVTSFSTNGDFLLKLPKDSILRISCEQKQRIYFMRNNVTNDSIVFKGFRGLTSLVDFIAEYATNIEGIQANSMKYSEELETFRIKSPIEGNIEDFKNCTNLTTLEIDYTNITGNIDTVLNAYAATGRTNTLSLKIPSGVTMTGRTSASAYTIQFANNSWSIVS